MVEKLDTVLKPPTEQREISDLRILSDTAIGLEQRIEVSNKILLNLIRQQSKMLQLLEKWLPKRVKNPLGIKAQQKLVTTAGTAVQLPYVEIPEDFEITIKALPANTGTIYIGDSKLNAEDHTISFPLSAGESLEYKVDNLNQLWIDSTVSAEGVAWTVEQDQ